MPSAIRPRARSKAPISSSVGTTLPSSSLLSNSSEKESPVGCFLISWKSWNDSWNPSMQLHPAISDSSSMLGLQKRRRHVKIHSEWVDLRALKIAIRRSLPFVIASQRRATSFGRFVLSLPPHTALAYLQCTRQKDLKPHEFSFLDQIFSLLLELQLNNNSKQR